jgi:hypothetical protein
LRDVFCLVNRAIVCIARLRCPYVVLCLISIKFVSHEPSLENIFALLLFWDAPNAMFLETYTTVIRVRKRINVRLHSSISRIAHGALCVNTLQWSTLHLSTVVKHIKGTWTCQTCPKVHTVV